MGKGYGSSRRTRWVGAFVVGLVLALAVPSIALAATASFTAKVPAPGSSSNNTKPTISVVVYDRYGVRYMKNMLMSIDGVKVTPTWTQLSTASSFSRFRLAYPQPTPLSAGSHTVKVYVKDRRGNVSRTSWSFTVVSSDVIPPVTTSNAQAEYGASATILLFPTDSGSGVAHTYHKLDGGTQIAGTAAFTSVLGAHTLEFWSVDNEGNVETHHVVDFALLGSSLFAHTAPENGCTEIVGCHGGLDTATIHWAEKCTPCHAPGVAATNDCQTCHGTSNPPPNHAVHEPILSSAAGTATDCQQSQCHGSALMGPHDSCATCHQSTSSTVVDVIAAGGATCEDCHGDYAATHTSANPSHVVEGSCFTSTCHGTDVIKMHTLDFRGTGALPPGCDACHGEGKTPSTNCSPCHTDVVTPHDYAAAHARVQPLMATNSVACVACHGSDLKNVLPAGNDITGVIEHDGCSCHAYIEARDKTSCQGCHNGAHAPHGFVNGVFYGEGYVAASGHNTTLLGTVGAFTKWDGSEGVVVKSSTGATITQEWPLPTASVFWSQTKALKLDGSVAGPVTSNPASFSLNPTDAPAVAMANRGGTNMASAINTTVGWGSVVTCQDCHTGLDSSMGPQGANVGQVGLDPNFPDDWKKAEITSFDPTGMRKIDTVRDTPNPYYSKVNASVYMAAEVEHPADPHNPWAGMSIETTLRPVYGAGSPSWPANPATVTIRPGGFFGLTDRPSNGYSMGNSTGRFICQKCHKLTNSYQGLGIEGNGRGARDNALNYMGMSNEAHMEHHNDLVTGQGNCVSCHVAIPHGWKRPRLLVYESDPAPYKVQYVWPEYRSTDTAVARNMAPTNLYTDGNWGYTSNPNNNGGSNRYGDLTALNPSEPGVLFSSHLSKVSASADALKELVVGPAEEFESYDALNSAAVMPYWGFGVNWGLWDMEAEGVEWVGDPNSATIPATVWDGATNSPITIQEHAIQTNCNGCTSAGAGTHAPQWSGNPGGEGVQPELPYWE